MKLLVISHVGPKLFEDQVIYLTGHAYYNCAFERCTFVLASGCDFQVIGCAWSACALHLDYIIHDVNSLDRLRTILTDFETMFLVSGSSVPPASGVSSVPFSAIP